MDVAQASRRKIFVGRITNTRRGLIFGSNQGMPLVLLIHPGHPFGLPARDEPVSKKRIAVIMIENYIIIYVENMRRR